MKNLITVVVIVYNSSKTVLETLESINKQTYKNIELIVTDDKSIDDTYNIVRNWLINNKKRFSNVKLIKVKHNTGTVGNINRGIKYAKGKYIRLIAGDDLLTECALEVCERVARKNHADWVIGRGGFIKENGEQMNRHSHIGFYNRNFEIIKNNFESVKKELPRNNIIFAVASFFLSKKLIDTVGGFDEKYPYYDDLPFFIKLCDYGYSPFVTEEIVCKYRIRNESVSHVNYKTKSDSNRGFQKSKCDYFFNVRLMKMLKNKFYKESLIQIYKMGYLKLLLLMRRI